MKAFFLSGAIDPPKWPDVGSILLENALRFPAICRPTLEEMAFISSILRADRERSMYGDEVLGLPPDQLFSKFDAEMAQTWAEKVFTIGSRTLEED